jgi:hypothetical protein
MDQEQKLLAFVREQKDRQAIYDCMLRYCRGIDRLDREMLLSAYHVDGMDDHGHFVGSVAAFADWVFGLHSTYQHYTQHFICNHRCEISGLTAHTESYYIFRSLNKKAPFYTLASGRYIDRLEKREDRWAIVHRICLVDVRDEHSAPTGTEGADLYMPSSRDKQDSSYKRPITVEPERVNAGAPIPAYKSDVDRG